MKEGNDQIPVWGKHTTAVHPAAEVFRKMKKKN